MELVKKVKIGNQEENINVSAYIKFALYNEFQIDIDELSKKTIGSLKKMKDIKDNFERFKNIDFSLTMDLYKALFMMLHVANPEKFNSFEDFSKQYAYMDLLLASYTAIGKFIGSNEKSIEPKVRFKDSKKKKKGN